MMHPAEWQAIEDKSDVKLGSSVRIEVFTEGETDVVLVDFMYPAFEPGASVESFDWFRPTDQNEVTDENRGPVFG